MCCRAHRGADLKKTLKEFYHCSEPGLHCFTTSAKVSAKNRTLSANSTRHWEWEFRYDHFAFFLSPVKSGCSSPVIFTPVRSHYVSVVENKSRWSVAGAFPAGRFLNSVFGSHRSSLYSKWSKTLEHLHCRKLFLKVWRHKWHLSLDIFATQKEFLWRTPHLNRIKWRKVTSYIIFTS